MADMIRGLARAVLLLALASTPAGAQTSDPFSLDGLLTGHDPVTTRRALAEHFDGVWNVVHTDQQGQARSGRAEVASNGSTITLYLDGPDGRENYRLVEADAVPFADDGGGMLGSLVARFERAAPAIVGDNGTVIAHAVPLPLDPEQTLLSFEKDDRNLDLFVDWADDVPNRLQVSLALQSEGTELQGIWNEETGDRLAAGGLATWIRGKPKIDGVLVVEDQLDPLQGTGYPYLPDGSSNAAMKPERTLVVYGQNLPESAERADLQSSNSPRISYRPGFDSEPDDARTIADAFQRAGIVPPDPLEAIVVKADLASGITPGPQIIEVNGAVGQWPLVFADQVAHFRFVRTPRSPTDTFFEGDSGYVELAFPVPIPVEPVAIRLLKGDAKPEEIGVLMATFVDDDDPEFRVYRSDPIQFYSRDDERRSPPADANALRVAVLDGMVLKAELLVPTQALPVPRVAQARIVARPDQLGELWKDALNRVAACHDETIDDYAQYQNEVKDDISKLIIAERGTRAVDIRAGDHAAALLIRDEFVRMTRALIPGFRQQAADVNMMRQARAMAQRNPQLGRAPFWRDSVATYVKSRGLFFDSKIEYSLADTLKLDEIARNHEVAPADLAHWAEAETTKAALAYVEKMEAAADWADAADACDIAALLLIAGHRAQPVIDNILPRLLKLNSDPGPPARQYWTADEVAHGYVRSLYVKGTEVRALEEYSSADTDVAVAAAAIVTGGLSFGAEVLGATTAAFWVAAGDIALDMAMALNGVQEYYSGEQFYAFAEGATPAMGEDILATAEQGRKSAVSVAAGFIAPAVKAPGFVKQVGEFRHFRSIAKGRALFADDVLSDLSKLSDADRTHLAAYYSDMARRVNTSGLGKLTEADRAAYSAFQDYFRTAETPSAVPAVPAATAPDTGAPRPNSSAETVDPNQTVTVNPATSDPNEMATTIAPNAWQPDPSLRPAPTASAPNPDEAVNLFEMEPGAWLASRGRTEIDARRIIARSARGETLTPEEILDKLDYMRLQRQQSLQAPPGAQ